MPIVAVAKVLGTTHCPKCGANLKRIELEVSKAEEVANETNA